MVEIYLNNKNYANLYNITQNYNGFLKIFSLLNQDELDRDLAYFDNVCQGNKLYNNSSLTYYTFQAFKEKFIIKDEGDAVLKIAPGDDFCLAFAASITKEEHYSLNIVNSFDYKNSPIELYTKSGEVINFRTGIKLLSKLAKIIIEKQSDIVKILYDICVNNEAENFTNAIGEYLKNKSFFYNDDEGNWYVYSEVCPVVKSSLSFSEPNEISFTMSQLFNNNLNEDNAQIIELFFEDDYWIEYTSA